MRRLRLPVAAAVSVALVIGVEIAAGGLDYKPAAVPDPCSFRPWRDTHGISDIENRVALSALAGAACRLHVSREELVLAFADPQRLGEFRRVHHIDNLRLADAARAGLLRAIDDAERSGRLNGLEVTALRFAAEHLPDDQITGLVRRLLG